MKTVSEIFNFIKVLFTFSPLGEIFDVVFQWCFFLCPIVLSVYYGHSNWLWWLIPYLGVGFFIAMFNDSGPEWLSYFMYYFWGPYFVTVGFVIYPFYWLMRYLGFMHERYTKEEIEASKYFEMVGRKLIEENRKKRNDN